MKYTSFSRTGHRERIERWRQCERVLNALTPHERQYHWDMSVWGKATDCGTIACAAGHCVLDAWFVEQGFRREYIALYVHDFFGTEGANRIFWNAKQRAVSTVIKEVREEIQRLGRVAAMTRAAA